jgi:hypothetical protein
MLVKERDSARNMDEVIVSNQILMESRLVSRASWILQKFQMLKRITISVTLMQYHVDIATRRLLPKLLLPFTTLTHTLRIRR